MLVSEYQSFMAGLQQKDFRQLFGIAKARFQRAAGLHPSAKAMLSKGIQFIDLARSEPHDLLCLLACLPPCAVNFLKCLFQLRMSATEALFITVLILLPNKLGSWHML